MCVYLINKRTTELGISKHNGIVSEKIGLFTITIVSYYFDFVIIFAVFFRSIANIIQ